LLDTVSLESRAKDFSLLQNSKSWFGTHLASVQWVAAPIPTSRKRPDPEANHSSPCSAQIKSSWSYISAPTCIFVALTGINFSFFLSFFLSSSSSYYYYYYCGPRDSAVGITTRCELEDRTI